MIRSVLLACALSLFVTTGSAAPAVPAPLPGDSLYQLDIPLTDQTGRRFALRDLRGRPQLVAMFYTSCRYVCPLIIDTLKATEHALPEALQPRVSVLVVSFDPERDDVAALATVAHKRLLDASRWRLARTDAAHVRELAAALDIQYRRLEDGEFNHASKLSLLDAEGRLVRQTTLLGKPDPEMVGTLESLL